MKHELKVPTVGESIQEVQIGQWLKGEGQWANKDESLVEIESDKATVNVAAPAAGIVVEVLHRQGDVVPVGTLIGYLEEASRPATATQPAAPGDGLAIRPTHRRRQLPNKLRPPRHPARHRFPCREDRLAIGPTPRPIAKPPARRLPVRPLPLSLRRRRPTTATTLNSCLPQAARPCRSAPCTARRRGGRRSCP